MTDHEQRVVRTPHDSAKPNPWYVSPRPNPAAEIRLIFFPFAGGGPSAFSAWLDELPDDIEACFAHYPGRGSRFNEPALSSLASLVEHLSQSIQPLTDKPFAFFGHSMGALVAFELARQMRQRNLPQPHLLFVSACGAPQIPDPCPPIHALPDSEFLDALKGLNGTPVELSQQLEVMQLLIPVLRADFEAVEKYRFHPGEPPFDFPIVAFGGLDDPRVSRERLAGWALQTNARFETEYFPGDHFFVHSVKGSIMRVITEEIRTSFARNRKSI